jgi:stress response protein SCP2
MQLSRGQRIRLSDITPLSALRVEVELQGIQADVACFGLDAQGHLSDERYMTFYNQPASPCGGVVISNAAGKPSTGFDLILNQLPQTIERLVFTAALDSVGVMRQLTQGKIALLDKTRLMAEFLLSGEQFDQERALMLMDIYRKDGVWRVSATGQGFNGGLDALVKHFGGEVASEPQSAPAPSPTTAPAPARLSLEKRMEKEAPQLVSLAKKASVSLAKRGLQATLARVGLVLDASGSMRWQYEKGQVQELLNRVLPLAMHFDDDGMLDTWVFGSKSMALTPASTQNIQSYTQNVDGGWKQWMQRTSPSINNEPAALEDVIRHYQSDQNAPPAYVIFVSDGGVSQDRKISQIIKDAAHLPIFWQFVGIGGHGYGVLERLDTMSGRVVDNAGFFAIDDLHEVSEEALYDRLLQEFPQWLKDARAKGIVR